MRRITRNPIIAGRPTQDQSQEPEDHNIAPISVRIAAAVRMTGIGRSKLYELIQEGAIDIVKIGSARAVFDHSGS